MKRWIHASEDANNKELNLDIVTDLLNKYNEESDADYDVNGKYLRYTSAEDDFVSYYNLEDSIKELKSEGVDYDEVVDDPGIILDYGEIESMGIEHAFEEEEYDDFKEEMDDKYGFA